MHTHNWGSVEWQLCIMHYELCIKKNVRKTKEKFRSAFSDE